VTFSTLPPPPLPPLTVTITVTVDVSQVVEHNYQLFLQTHQIDQPQQSQQQQQQQQQQHSDQEIQDDEKQDHSLLTQNDFIFEETKSLPTASSNDEEKENDNLLPLTATTLQSLSSSSSASAPAAAAGGVDNPLVPPLENDTLEMIIYKKRDHLNTWVLRYLTCDGEYLHYYEDIDEVFPKKSLLIDENLQIQVDILPVVIDHQKRFTFTITHPEMKVQYILASNTLEDSLRWSNLIQNIQRKSQRSHLEEEREREKGEGKEIVEEEEEDGGGGKFVTSQPLLVRQISDEIQFYELNYSSRGAEDADQRRGGRGGISGQLSLTRLVITSLPLYYITVLWRYSTVI
jgi:hypothetical protein